MVLFVGKLAISAYLIMLAYIHSTDEILQKTFHQTVQANINNLTANERTKEFLRLYLTNIIIFCLFTSVLGIFSRNILPKIVCAAGLALWIYFSIPPNAFLPRFLLKITEEICLIGGLLFIAGSEYIEASFLLEPPTSKEKQKQN